MLESLKMLFANTYKFSNHDTNKFILLMGKDAYLYESYELWKIQWNTWKRRFSESPNMGDVTDTDCTLKWVYKDFEIKVFWGNIMICMLKVIHYC